MSAVDLLFRDVINESAFKHKRRLGESVYCGSMPAFFTIAAYFASSVLKKSRA